MPIVDAGSIGGRVKVSGDAPLLDLASIRSRALEYAARIGLPTIKVFGSPQGDGSPYVEVTDAYNFVVEERGIELDRRRTQDLDELLYWIMEVATFSVSVEFERRNRVPNEDPRRQLFASQEALLGQFSLAWKDAKHKEHAQVLARHPFNDRIMGAHR